MKTETNEEGEYSDKRKKNSFEAEKEERKR